VLTRCRGQQPELLSITVARPSMDAPLSHCPQKEFAMSANLHSNRIKRSIRARCVGWSSLPTIRPNIHILLRAPRISTKANQKNPCRNSEISDNIAPCHDNKRPIFMVVDSKPKDPETSLKKAKRRAFAMNGSKVRSRTRGEKKLPNPASLVEDNCSLISQETKDLWVTDPSRVWFLEMRKASCQLVFLFHRQRRTHQPS